MGACVCVCVVSLALFPPSLYVRVNERASVCVWVCGCVGVEYVRPSARLSLLLSLTLSPSLPLSLSLCVCVRACVPRAFHIQAVGGDDAGEHCGGERGGRG